MVKPLTPSRSTGVEHTGTPSAAKETGKVQAKQSKHVKAKKDEGEIIQAEFDNHKVQNCHAKPTSCDESTNSSMNYKLIKVGQKQV